MEKDTKEKPKIITKAGAIFTAMVVLIIAGAISGMVWIENRKGDSMEQKNEEGKVAGASDEIDESVGAGNGEERAQENLGTQLQKTPAEKVDAHIETLVGELFSDDNPIDQESTLFK